MGAGGAGGAGGTPLRCSELSVVGPPLGIADDAAYHQYLPRLSLSSDDGARVTIVSLRTHAQIATPTEIRHSSLEPWQDFPAGETLSQGSVAQSNAGVSVAAARAGGDHFALAFDVGTASGGIAFSPGFTPYSSEVPPAELLDPVAHQPLFVAQGPGGHLVGTQIVGAPGIGDPAVLRVAVVGEDGSQQGPVDVGCATDAMNADAVGAGDRWIMAMSNGTPFGTLDCNAPEISFPDEVQIIVAKTLSIVQTDTLSPPAGDMKMAPRSDGAWLVVSTIPGQVPKPLFQAVRIDLEGHVVSMFPVGSPSPEEDIPLPGTLAVAGVDDHLVTAWVDVAGDKGPFIKVSVLDPEGAPLGTVQVFATPDHALSGAPALVGSPVSRSALLAWSESSAVASAGNRIRAVRIDCVGQP